MGSACASFALSPCPHASSLSLPHPEQVVVVDDAVAQRGGLGGGAAGAGRRGDRGAAGVGARAARGSGGAGRWRPRRGPGRAGAWHARAGAPPAGAARARVGRRGRAHAGARRARKRRRESRGRAEWDGGVGGAGAADRFCSDKNLMHRFPRFPGRTDRYRHTHTHTHTHTHSIHPASVVESDVAHGRRRRAAAAAAASARRAYATRRPRPVVERGVSLPLALAGGGG